MSTNYYAFGEFPGGELDGEGLHIGQTAAGWCFLFQGHPAQGLTTLLAWRALLHQQATSIRDEYGVEYTADEMIEIATLHQRGEQMLRPRFATFERLRDHEYIDPDGHHAFNDHEFF